MRIIDEGDVRRGEKGDCLRCYLRHMSCDLRGGRLRFRVRSRHLRLSHWLRTRLWIPLSRACRHSKARNQFLDRFGAIASNGLS